MISSRSKRRETDSMVVHLYFQKIEHVERETYSLIDFSAIPQDLPFLLDLQLGMNIYEVFTWLEWSDIEVFEKIVCSSNKKEKKSIEINNNNMRCEIQLEYLITGNLSIDISLSSVLVSDDVSVNELLMKLMIENSKEETML